MRAGLTEARFPFLARLGEAGRRELGAFSASRVVAAKRLLARGDRVEGAYLVVGGSLRVYTISAEGREATLYHVEPGQTCILALSATFQEEPYPAWVSSGPRGASFVCVPSGVFRRLLGVEPAFREFVFSALSGRVFELMSAIEETRSAQMEQRLSRHLLRRAEVDGAVRATQAGIAAELGTAREVVFRALRSLAARGLVETGRKRVAVIDREGLGAVADGRSSTIVE